MSQTLVDAPSRSAVHLTKVVLACKKNQQKKSRPKVLAPPTLAHAHERPAMERGPRTVGCFPT